ncbi:MAG: hypothetical protein J6A01_03595 [Proteobacteria bacterium]|nr:hypothetical protein [Pseudomonadota bacterium]
MKNIRLIIPLTILLVSCTPKLDTSTLEAQQKSIHKMKNSLSFEESDWLSASLKLCTEEKLCDIHDYNGLQAEDIVDHGRILKLKKMKAEADTLITPYRADLKKSAQNNHDAIDKINKLGSPIEDLKKNRQHLCID